jgi:hypothetical protein
MLCLSAGVLGEAGNASGGLHMNLFYNDLENAIRSVKLEAKAKLVCGTSADEFTELARVGHALIYVAATQDYPDQKDQVPHSNSRDSLMYMLEGSANITFTESGEQFRLCKGGVLKVPARCEHIAVFKEMAVYLSVVDDGIAT